MKPSSEFREQSAVSPVSQERPSVGTAGNGSQQTFDRLEFNGEKQERLIGVPFALLGTAATAGFLARGIKHLLDPSLPKIASLVYLPAMGLGLLFVFVGIHLLLWRDTLSLDCASRVYRRTRGWGPWAKKQSGPFSDFNCIGFMRSFGRKRHPYWRATLRWKTASVIPVEFDLFKYSHPLGSTPEVNHLAAVLEIPTDFSAVEAQTRHDLDESKKRTAWNKKLRPYKTGLLTLVILLVSNSLISGFYWQDSWSEGNSKLLERRSTLFHTLTRAESAGRSIGYSDRKWLVFGYLTQNNGVFAKSNLSTANATNYRWTIGYGPFPPSADSITKIKRAK